MRACLVPVLFVLLSASPARAQDVPWNKIHDGAALTASQRTVAEQVMRSAKCYGPCSGTVLECLNRSDAFGLRLANFVARRAAEKRTAATIATELDHRRLSAFPADTMKVDLAGLIPSGNPTAPVRVVIFADFDCPYCREAATALRGLSTSMPDSFSLWFKNYPLAQDDRAVPAALAYLAAEQQGRGWQMFDAMFASTGDLTDAALDSCAVGAGLDMDEYRTDLKSDATMRRVRAEKAEGVTDGFTRVPGILVDGKPYLGIKTKRELLDRIEEELEIVRER
jgi:predicted DsbA family dithiol-disulfide isomerase